MDYLGYGSWWGTFGDTFGVQLKGQVWKMGNHAISLGADLGLCVSYLGWTGWAGAGWGGVDLGLQIGGPELKYSYRWNNPRIAIIAGFRMPIRVWFLNAAWAEIPFLWNVALNTT